MGARVLLMIAALWTALMGSAAATPGDAENAAFLADFKKQPGVVQRSTGVGYRVLRSGFGKRPGPADTVAINYTGRLVDGSVFDGSQPGLPASFAVNGVIKGLSEALQLMHIGDHWEVVVPPDLGFGVKGAGNGSVPPNQILVFDVTLIAVSDVPPPASEGTSPLSIGADARGQKAVLTIHP